MGRRGCLGRRRQAQPQLRHQNALLAGLTAARGDAVVTIDADLQDDEAAIAGMLDAFEAGSEVIYGVRSKRTADTWFKRVSAHAFYRAMALLGVQTVYDHADYRLLSRRAVGCLLQFQEVNSVPPWRRATAGAPQRGGALRPPGAGGR